MNPNKKFKCPFCKVHDTKEKLINHIEKKHQEMIPDGFTAARVLFHAIHKRPYNVKGSCVICKGETEWNERTYKYNRLCNRRECKDKLRESYKKNMLKVYGTYNILNDMEQQEKMLANRSISGVYKFRNGKLKQFVGSYEKKFLEFCDLMLNMDPDDIMMPGPTIEYEYRGEKHQWITDAMIIPYNLLIDVKDGSSNPNNREMISYREKQIEKEKVITNKGEYNYLRLTNNEFDQLIGIIYELKMQMIDDPESTNKISRVHEDSLIFDDDTYYYNWDKWKSGGCQFVFLLGPSGAGKSTLGRKIAKEFRVQYIEMDLFSKQIDKVRPDIEDIEDDHIRALKRLDYMKHYLGNKRAVLDGFTFGRCGFDALKDECIIILGTSVLKSTYRATMRAWKDPEREKNWIKDPNSKIELYLHLLNVPFNRLKRNINASKAHHPKYVEVVDNVKKYGTTHESTEEVYYRVTYNGNGIYEELKKKVGFGWKELKDDPAFTWLPKPPEYKGNYRSYFTEKGYKEFKSKTLPIAKKFLSSSNIKVQKSTDIKGEIVYQDEYQIVIKEDTSITESTDYDLAKKVYDNLPDNEKKLVSPRGEFADSPYKIYRHIEKINNKPIGFIDAYKYNGTSDTVAFVILAVSSQYRGKGIAKKMLTNCCIKLKEMGYKKVVYKLDKENKGSFNLINNYEGSKKTNETKTQLSFEIPLNESSQPIFISEKDIEYRLDEFMDHKLPVLWITGMSGGGKTTTTKKLANKMSCECFSIDNVEGFIKLFMKEDTKTMKEWIKWNSNFKVIDDYLKKNPNHGYMKDRKQWGKFVSNVIELIAKKHSKSNPIIFEGVQIPYIYYYKKTLFENSAIIIKGTSITTSIMRRFNRDQKGGHFINNLQDIGIYMKMYYDWYKEQNEFRNKGPIKESSEEYTKNFVLPIDTTKFKSNKFLLCINTHNVNATLTLVDIVLNNPLSFKQYTGLASNWNEQKEARDFILIDSNNPSNFDESFEGSNVRSIGDGKIVLVKKNYAQYGNCICIDHGSSISTYCHLKDNSMKVNKGDTVKCGQVIGKIGSTGNSDIPHLHFELTERPFKSGIKATGFNMYEYIELEESDLWGVKDFKKVTDKCKAGRWIRSKSDELPQYCIIKDNTMKTITESVKIPEIKPEDVQFIKAYDGTNNAYITYKGDNYRVRVETLIVNDKGEVYIDKSDKYAKYGIQYRIPGGSVEPKRDFVTQAENECKEEVHINIKNAYYSGQNWVMLFPPNSNSGIPNFSYKGCISYIYVAEYNGKYHGYVKVADRDDMYKTGKFYKYKDVKWLPEHKQALDDYFKSHTKI